MELNVFLRALLRRWPVLIAVLVLAGAGTFVAFDRVGPAYETTGSTLIFPPIDADGTGPEVAGGNPYLELAGLTQARDIVIRTLTSKTTRAEIETIYPDMAYDVAPDFTNSAPIILFTVEASGPRTSTEVLAELMGRVPSTLAGLQSGRDLAKSQLITSVALTEDSDPEVVRKDQIRAGIFVGAGILGAGLLLLGLIDSLFAARRSRRHVAAHELVAATTPAPAPSPAPSPGPSSAPSPGPSPAQPDRMVSLRAERSQRSESHHDPAGVPGADQRAKQGAR